VAWSGSADRVLPTAADAAGGWAARERASIVSLVDEAADLGVEWLTIQVATSASVLAPMLRQELADRAAVRTLGAPWAERPTTPAGVGLTVVLAEGAQGRTEIVHAVAAMAADGLPPEAVDEKVLAGYLYEPDVPDPDLVVVTGGDRRVPDLLLWEIAYSELVFSEAAWPEVDGSHLRRAVDEYRRRHRRYGGIVPAAKAPRGGRR
jgi:hypothetical protein